MKLLFATGNDKKYELMKSRLKGFKQIELYMPKQLGININVNEDGKTAEENAQIKAKEYYQKTKLATIAEDSGLYIEEFSKENQPGLCVKRIHGKEDASNEEILEYYINKLEQIGGESLANYKTGIAMINENGKLYSTTIDEEPFVLTTKKSSKQFLNGGILDVISYDIKSKKYFNELDDTDKKQRYKKVDDEIKKFIETIL